MYGIFITFAYSLSLSYINLRKEESEEGGEEEREAVAILLWSGKEYQSSITQVQKDHVLQAL